MQSYDGHGLVLSCLCMSGTVAGSKRYGSIGMSMIVAPAPPACALLGHLLADVLSSLAGYRSSFPVASGEAGCLS